MSMNYFYILNISPAGIFHAIYRLLGLAYYMQIFFQCKFKKHTSISLGCISLGIICSSL